MNMLKKLAFICCAISLVFLGAVAAQADLIVDTSAGLEAGGPYTGGIVLGHGNGIGEGGQWLAERVFLSQAYTVTQILLLVGYSAGNGGDIQVVIRTDDGGPPGGIMFSQAFTSSNPGFYSWQGPSGLSWALTAGTYWLAFEVDASSSFDGAVKNNTLQSMPNPQTFYGGAVFNGGHPYEVCDLNLGIKIFGDLSPEPNPILAPPPPYTYSGGGVSGVPLPPTALLLGSGLLGLAGWRRFRKV